MLSIKQEFEEQFFFLIELPRFECGLYSLRQIFPIVKHANF